MYKTFNDWLEATSEIWDDDQCASADQAARHLLEVAEAWWQGAWSKNDAEELIRYLYDYCEIEKEVK